MSARKVEYELMSLNDLWSLHERISALLAARIRAEKHELEKRLAFLNQQTQMADQAGAAPLDQKPRRQYPEVRPKYRNPHTSETWSGRGKRPRWLVAAMKSGHKIEDFRIKEANGINARQRA